MSCVLIYAAGGMQAPAPFMIGLIPIGTGAFFGFRYIKASVISSLILLIIVSASAYYFPPPELKMDYDFQKITNTLIFIFICSAFIFNYTKTIEKNEKEIRHKSQEVDLLLKTLIHDIATPLLVAHSCVKREKELTKADKHLKTITQIIQDVRRIKSAHDGNLNLLCRPINFELLIEDLKFLTHDMLEAKNITLKIENLIPKESIIKSDISVLKNNIILNLITNAIKFSHPQQIIELQFKLEDNHFQVRVKDQGIGIPDEILANLFKGGKNKSRKGTAGEPGTGFGLSIVYSLVKEMGGDMIASSDQSTSGTVITVTLPA